MKKCNSCGSLMADDCRFCAECGSSDIISIPNEPAAPPPVNEPAPAAPSAAPQYAQTQQPFAGEPVPPAPQPQQPFQPSVQQPAPQAQGYAAGGYPSAAAPAGSGAQGYYRQTQTTNAAPAGGYYPAGTNVPPGGAPYQQPVGPYQYAGQPNYAPAQPVKKKKKIGLIIAIVLGVLFIFGAVIIFIGARIAKKAMDDLDPNAYIDELISEFEDDFDDDAAPDAAYTKGELVGNVYTNEWAGITFTLPEGFVNGSEEDYDSGTDPYTDACLVAENGNNGISFLVEAAGGFSGMTEDDYLKEITADMLDDEMISGGWSLGEVYPMTIAGETYRAIKTSNSYTEAFEEIVACRIYDDHMLCFICYGDTTAIDAFFESVTTP